MMKLVNHIATFQPTFPRLLWKTLPTILPKAIVALSTRNPLIGINESNVSIHSFKNHFAYL